MLNQVVHIGLTVSDLEASKKFYGEVLGLDYVGELKMEGEATDVLFGHPHSKCSIAYFKDNSYPQAPAIELIQYDEIHPEIQQTSLRRTSVSEICFAVLDIEAEYERLKSLGVKFISAPQEYDFSEWGMGKSKAVYLYDPDGIILELTQVL